MNYLFSIGNIFIFLTIKFINDNVIKVKTVICSVHDLIKSVSFNHHNSLNFISVRFIVYYFLIEFKN